MPHRKLSAHIITDIFCRIRVGFFPGCNLKIVFIGLWAAFCVSFDVFKETRIFQHSCHIRIFGRLPAMSVRSLPGDLTFTLPITASRYMMASIVILSTFSMSIYSISSLVPIFLFFNILTISAKNPSVWLPFSKMLKDRGASSLCITGSPGVSNAS